MEIDKDFQNFYKQAIGPDVNLSKKKTFEHGLTVLSVFSLIVAFFFLFVFFKTDNWSFVFMFLLLVVGGFAFINIDANHRKHNKRLNIYKTKLLPLIFRYYYPDVKYEPKQSFSLETVLNSSLFFADPESLKGSDLVQVENRGKPVYFCVFSHGKIVGAFPSFCGVFVVVPFNKKFSSRTTVFSRKGLGPTNLMLERMRAMFNGGEVAEMEVEEFNKKFIVFTEDQVEARYLLSLNFMERIIKYQQRLGSDFSFSFVENHLYLKIPFHFLPFYVELIEGVDDYFSITSHVNVFLRVTDVVEDLALDTDLW